MRPSSLGGGRILRRTLSVRLSVRPVIVFVYLFTLEPSYERTSKIEKKTSVFAYGPASRMYFSARTEGRISYGHLGRTNLLFTYRIGLHQVTPLGVAFLFMLVNWWVEKHQRFYSTFTNGFVYIFVTFLTFFSFFYGTFFTSMRQGGYGSPRFVCSFTCLSAVYL